MEADKAKNWAVEPQEKKNTPQKFEPNYIFVKPLLFCLILVQFKLHLLY
jgi:hypothetical protein